MNKSADQIDFGPIQPQEFTCPQAGKGADRQCRQERCRRRGEYPGELDRRKDLWRIVGRPNLIDCFNRIGLEVSAARGVSQKRADASSMVIDRNRTETETVQPFLDLGGVDRPQRSVSEQIHEAAETVPDRDQIDRADFRVTLGGQVFGGQVGDQDVAGKRRQVVGVEPGGIEYILAVGLKQTAAFSRQDTVGIRHAQGPLRLRA